jgi:hypothetical protein
MPGGNRTGPMGFGPMTGRVAGYCAGFGVPGYVNPVYGRGFWGWGRGRGSGRGRRRWPYAPGFTGWPPVALGWPAPTSAWPAGSYVSPFVPAAMTRQQEVDALKGQAEYFEGVLDGLRSRIEALEPKTANA